MTSVAQTDERITRRKKNRAPAMSLTSLDLKGELPPFFTFVVEDRLAACGDFDPDKVADQLKNLAGRRVGGVISLTEGCSCATALEAPLFESSIELLHLPTEDLTPPTLSDLQRGVEFISRVCVVIYICQLLTKLINKKKQKKKKNSSIRKTRQSSFTVQKESVELVQCWVHILLLSKGFLHSLLFSM